MRFVFSSLFRRQHQFSVVLVSPTPDAISDDVEELDLNSVYYGTDWAAHLVNQVLDGLSLGLVVFRYSPSTADWIVDEVAGATDRLGQVHPLTLLGQPFSEVVPEPFRALLRSGLDAARKTNTIQDRKPTLYERDGRRQWRRWQAIPLDSDRVALAFSDVTKHIDAERALKEAQERYHLLTEATRDGIWDYDVANASVYLSPSWMRQLGYEADELPSALETWRNLLHPDDREQTLERLEHYLKLPEGLWQEEFRLRQKDGTYRWVMTRGMPVFDESGTIVRLFGAHIDIGERKRIESERESLLEAFRLYERIVSTTADLMSYVDTQYIYRIVNDAYARHFRCDRNAIVGKAVAQVAGSDAFEKVIRPQLDRCFAGETIRYQAEFSDVSGQWHADVSYSPHFSDDGQVLGAVVTVRDVSELIEAQQKLEQTAEVFRSTTQSVAILDLRGQIRDVNEAFCRTTHWIKADALRMHWSELRAASLPDEHYDQQWTRLLSTGCWSGESWIDNAHGDSLPVALNLSTVRDADGSATGFVAVFSDVSEERAAAARLDFLAHHDPLTGLPNRRLLFARLDQSIGIAARGGSGLAVMFFDIDRFKEVNDTLGHGAGDAILSTFADRLRYLVRDEDTIARISGDEFVGVFQGVETSAQVSTLVERLNTALSRPFYVDGQRLYLTCSIGVSMFPDDGGCAETLLQRADAAMYRAKESGRNTFRHFDQQMTDELLTFVQLKGCLREALDESQFRLAYQPQFELENGKICGVEALIRWSHAELGNVSPALFIPAAERSGLISKIGAWVLDEACRQAADWGRRGYDFGRVAVNVSARELRGSGFEGGVRRTLERHGIAAERIELEITETTMMEQIEATASALGALTSRGLTFAVDDFGTGYSSLVYLKQLPLQRLKLDRTFVRDLPDDPNDVAISEAVLAMATALGLTVVAEGVEEEAQVEFLRRRGCHQAQGYHFSRPVFPDELEAKFGPIL